MPYVLPQSWLTTQGVSPVSGEPMAHRLLVPNRLAKDIIADILPSPQMNSAGTDHS
jgi:hypothetical protein